MPLKTYKPTSAGVRHMSTADFSELTRTTPEKSLTRGKISTGVVITKVVSLLASAVAL